MNLENVKKLHDLIESLPEKAVQMNRVLDIDRDVETVEEAINHTCGTVGCLYGWAGLLMAMEDERKKTYLYQSSSARFVQFKFEQITEWLGLSYDDGSKLFYGGWWAGNHRDQGLDMITKEQVMHQLRKMLETGEV